MPPSAGAPPRLRRPMRSRRRCRWTAVRRARLPCWQTSRLSRQQGWRAASAEPERLEAVERAPWHLRP
eukprot:4420225-Alexandrium_andersonii.AAC.1